MLKSSRISLRNILASRYLQLTHNRLPDPPHHIQAVFYHLVHQPIHKPFHLVNCLHSIRAGQDTIEQSTPGKAHHMHPPGASLSRQRHGRVELPHHPITTGSQELTVIHEMLHGLSPVAAPGPGRWPVQHTTHCRQHHQMPKPNLGKHPGAPNVIDILVSTWRNFDHAYHVIAKNDRLGELLNFSWHCQSHPSLLQAAWGLSRAQRKPICANRFVSPWGPWLCTDKALRPNRWQVGKSKGKGEGKGEGERGSTIWGRRNRQKRPRRIGYRLFSPRFQYPHRFSTRRKRGCQECKRIRL